MQAATETDSTQISTGVNRVSVPIKSFLLPEVLPYRGSGQLVALVGTLPAGLAYGQQVAARGAEFGPGRFAERLPSGAAIVFGMLVAIAVLLASSGGSLAGWARAAWRRGRS